MAQVSLHGSTFDLLIEATSIRQKIKEMAGVMTHDYQGKTPLFLAVLNGTFMFAGELFGQLQLDAEISFVKLQSYHGMASTGAVQMPIGLDIPIADRHIIILEDIVDTGRTLHEFLSYLQSGHPASIRIASLLYKPHALKWPVPVDYIGFAIKNEFVVGYGMDYNGLGRNLPAIYQLDTAAGQ